MFLWCAFRYLNIYMLWLSTIFNIILPIVSLVLLNTFITRFFSFNSTKVFQSFLSWYNKVENHQDNCSPQHIHHKVYLMIIKLNRSFPITSSVTNDKILGANWEPQPDLKKNSPLFLSWYDNIEMDQDGHAPQHLHQKVFFVIIEVNRSFPITSSASILKMTKVMVHIFTAIDHWEPQPDQNKSYNLNIILISPFTPGQWNHG